MLHDFVFSRKGLRKPKLTLYRLSFLEKGVRN